MQTNAATIMTTRVRVPSAMRTSFADWQAELNMVIAAFPGFVSLEITAFKEDGQSSWTIVQRFNKSENLIAWKQSKAHENLLIQLRKLLGSTDPYFIEEEISGISGQAGSVTEVFVTQVSLQKEEQFRQWIAKIHQVEAKFPGFQGMYVQSPNPSEGTNWITFLQFDTPEHLDHWLASPERQQVLKEAKSLIKTIENHRVISPYGGWFASLSEYSGTVPPVWKQTMIVLLVLFPIVMLEFRFLSPLTQNLNLSLGTFIGNALSVSLIAWPGMPLAIKCLAWWLSPRGFNIQRATILGTLLILVLYLIEVIIFWK